MFGASLNCYQKVLCLSFSDLFPILLAVFFCILIWIFSAESPYMEMATELCNRGSLKQSLMETQYWAHNQHSTVFFLLRGIVHGMEYLHDLGYLHKV